MLISKDVKDSEVRNDIQLEQLGSSSSSSSRWTIAVIFLNKKESEINSYLPDVAAIWRLAL